MEQQFGKYTLLKKLGDGGMAEVFLAEMKGPEGFSKLVAIKRILPHLSHDAVFTESFINEARLGGYLNHHNIVQTLDFGQIDGFYYLAMEYVQGIDLRQILQLSQKEATRLPLALALDIGYQICEGLVYAHQATDAQRRPLRMIHRDLKPSNILINTHGVVKIADFGVARAESNVAHTQMASGNPKGTVAYMSSEQAWGSLDLDQRADIFSLGAIFYELVTNERLYTGATYMAALRQAQDGEVEDRIARVAALPRGELVLPILQKALAKDPEARYANSRTFAKELRRALLQVESEESLHDYIGGIIPRLATEADEANRARPAIASSMGDMLRGRPASRSGGDGGANDRAASPASPGWGGAGMDGQVLVGPEAFEDTDDDAYGGPATPTPVESTPATPPPPQRSNGARHRRQTDPEASSNKALQSQTLRPSTADEAARPAKRGPWGALLAVVAAVVLAGAGAIVTLSMLGRPTWVSVKTDPEGARITQADGVVVDTPSKVKVPPEGVTLTISLDGYQSRELTIPGGAPDGQVWPIKLQPFAASLTVQVEPANAELFINGLRAPGSNPWTLKDVASKETLSLELKAPGHQPLRQDVTLEPGETRALTLSLQPVPVATPAPVAAPPTDPSPRQQTHAPAPPKPRATAAQGYLACNAMPKGGGSMWARVFVDGRYVGNTPVLKHPLAEGKHTLLLVAEDGRQKSRDFSVGADRTTRLVVEFD